MRQNIRTTSYNAGNAKPTLGALALVLFLASLLAFFSCAKKPAQKASKEKKTESRITINRVGEVTFSSTAPGPINILLLGSDSRTESIAGRSDAIMIVHINPQKKSAKLVSFPRDSRVPIPGRGTGKINSAMTYGGPNLTVQTIEQLTGIEIHYYAVTTFAGFTRIINGLGGVQIDIDAPIHDRWAGANLQAGPQRLDSSQALAFCRSRHIPGADFARAGHQQDLLVAAFEQEKQGTDAQKLLRLANLIINDCETSLSFREMFELARLVVQIEPQAVEKTVLPGTTANVGGASYVILNQGRLNQIFNAIKNDNGQ